LFRVCRGRSDERCGKGGGYLPDAELPIRLGNATALVAGLGLIFPGFSGIIGKK
jgi:hypothetical protein